MKTPDQNKNLPKNKQEAEKNLKQQPKIPKEVIIGILAGIGSLPVIQAIGEKMRPPKIDKTESLAARADQKEAIEQLDERIKNIQKELTSLGDNIQSYDETKAEELSNEIANLNKLKSGKGEFMDGKIAKKEAKEKENFANNFPEAALKDLEKQRIEEDKYLTEQFENSKNIDDKAALGGEINAQIQRYADRKSELESIVNQKKQDKIDEKIKKENDLKELDSKAIKTVRDTLQKAREEDKELNRQNRVQKEKDIELNKLKKVQEDGARLTAKANKISEKAAIKQENEVFSIFDRNDARDERLTTLKEKQNKQESKLDNEMEAKKDHVSIFDKLKSSVKSASKKGLDVVKAKIKENDEAKLNPKPKEKKLKQKEKNNRFDLGALISKVNIVKQKPSKSIFIAGENGIEEISNQKSENAEIKAKAQKQIQKLSIEHKQKRTKLVEKLKSFNQTKDAKNKVKVRDEILKMDEKFNQAMEVQKSILEDK